MNAEQKHNVELIKGLAKLHHKPIRELDQVKIMNSIVGVLKCIQCREWGISSAIVMFFDKDGTKLKCYDCQKIKEQV